MIYDITPLKTKLDVSVSPNDETCKQLDVAEPVDSSTQSVPPTPEAPSGKFVGNVDIVVDNSNSSPSSVPFVHDNLFAVLDSADASEPSSVPPAKELVFSNSPLPFTFASHDTSPTHPRDPFVDDESTLRSRGGRPLKPSQRLKEMEWFTVTGKGKRGRGRVRLEMLLESTDIDGSGASLPPSYKKRCSLPFCLITNLKRSSAENSRRPKTLAVELSLLLSCAASLSSLSLPRVALSLSPRRHPLSLLAVARSLSLSLSPAP
ncbi:hypothetical protein YC2023_113642 [Brassica napus]